MTEQEAIKEVKRWTSILMSAGSKCVSYTAEAQDMAINALEEVQKYREIGTVSELQDLVIGINALADSQFSAADMEKLVNDMKSLYEYRQIGTTEEFRAAVEKQRKKKILNPLTSFSLGTCPVCSIHQLGRFTYCSRCGQKLDWSDEE